MFSLGLSGPRLHKAAKSDRPWPAVYGLGSVMQVSRDKCLLIANRRALGVPIVDFEDGADAFAFDSLEDLTEEAAIPLLHNYQYVDHPIGSVCRLADGKVRTLLCFRVTDAATNACGISQTPASGLYLEELHVTGGTARRS